VRTSVAGVTNIGESNRDWPFLGADGTRCLALLFLFFHIAPCGFCLLDDLFLQ
jgi:hypothetical protein